MIYLLFLAFGSAMAGLSGSYLIASGMSVWWMLAVASGSACLGVLIDLAWRLTR